MFYLQSDYYGNKLYTFQRETQKLGSPVFVFVPLGKIMQATWIELRKKICKQRELNCGNAALNHNFNRENFFIV